MANQINNIALTHIKLALHNDFHNQVLTLITDATAEALHIEEKADLYRDAISRENSIVKRKTSYVSTAMLKEKDKLRDRAFGCLSKCIVAHRTSVITEKREAALALDAVIDPYKGLATHEYRAETREIDGLLSALGSEENAAHIQTLGLTAEVDALDAMNCDFATAMSGKQSEESARTVQTSTDTTELRAEIDDIYEGIVQIVNAYAVIQSTSVIEQFITDVNAVITLVKRSAAAGGTTDTEEEQA